ncbi:hypothetical protein FRX31_024854 [Thalictrum thalictroides]|uniref:Uncharacterized protein n=1 Tax=Thalictrum thalictroides TaxID=46969 RepID=A0A7J6VKB5_THATH|nr:hypothetical protein FRX31_024854 [Thalictrum thalictroides]
MEKATRDRETLLKKPKLDKEVLEKASLEQELEKARRDRETLLEKPRLDKEVLEKASLEQEVC